MEKAILCYGIKSKFGLTQIEKISFDNLGKPGYDYQVAFKTLSEGGGNAQIDLLLFKDGQEVNSLELEGWIFQKLHISMNWSGTVLEVEAIDLLGETQQIEIDGDNGLYSPYKLSYQELLTKWVEEMKRISTFGSFCMLNLCDSDFTNFSSCTLSSYNATLKYMSEFCQKVEVVRERLCKNPEDKDITAYNNIIKPKLIKYMDELSKVRINPDILNLK